LSRPQSGQESFGTAVSSAFGRFFRELGEVLRLVARSRVIGFVLASIVVSTFISAVSYTVLIFMVQQVLGLGTAGVGVFAGILAVGMIGGALSMGFVPQNINRQLVIVVTVLLYGLLFVLGWFHVSTGFLVAVALLSGVSFSWLSIVQSTILQEETTDEIRARIFSTREFIVNATFIVSTVTVGLVGDMTSYRRLLPVIGFVLIVLAVSGFLFIRKRD